MANHQAQLFASLIIALVACASTARADIFQWEYLDSADPSQGKQQSTTLAPDGAGANAVQGTNLSNRNLTKAYLSGADLSAYRVANDAGAELYRINSDLTAVNLSAADVTNVKFDAAKVVGANFTGADVRGAAFRQDLFVPGSGLSLVQLYSTTSCANHDLGPIYLGGNLVGANFAMQNLAGATLGPDLTNVNFSQASLRNANLYSTLAGANFSGADVRGARVTGSVYGPLGGLTLAQLYSTASYQAHDLAGVRLFRHDLTNGNFVGQNLAGVDLQGSALAHADFSHSDLSGVRFTDFYDIEVFAADLTGANRSHANLTNAIVWSDFASLSGANLTGADARGAQGFEPLPATSIVANLIRPNGHVAGLDLTAGTSLAVRDYDGNPNAEPAAPPLPVTVEQHVAMDANGTLRLVFDADDWDSTIYFTPNIPVTLGGMLELTFAAGVNPLSQLGRTIDLFDWTGVAPTATFNVQSPYSWDVSSLYTSGEVTLVSVPEPASLALLALAAIP